jgi:hypothetical protein
LEACRLAYNVLEKSQNRCPVLAILKVKPLGRVPHCNVCNKCIVHTVAIRVDRFRLGAGYPMPIAPNTRPGRYKCEKVPRLIADRIGLNIHAGKVKVSSSPQPKKASL